MISTYTVQELLAGAARSGPSVVALGTFDGVHCGHVAILDAAARLAHSLSATAMAFTFDRLPLEVVHPARAPLRLLPHQRRLELLTNYVDQVVAVRFNGAFANLTAQQFVTDILAAGLNCVGAVAGFNFTFGQEAAGNAHTLQQLGQEMRMTINIVDPITVCGNQVSSTLIRELVTNGDVEQAACCLGRPYSLEGEVVVGNQIGRRLGFPTANLASAAGIAVPGPGVYLTQVFSLPEATFLGPAVTAISTRPTFGEGLKTIESHILDFSGNLYQSRIMVAFRSRLREIRTFSNDADLRSQIAVDVAKARQLWLNLGK